jgi:hypothetical protein
MTIFRISGHTTSKQAGSRVSHVFDVAGHWACDLIEDSEEGTSGLFRDANGSKVRRRYTKDNLMHVGFRSQILPHEIESALRQTMPTPLLMDSIGDIDLVRLQRASQVYFNGADQPGAGAIEYAKGSPRAAATPAFQIALNVRLDSCKGAAATAKPLRYLVIFTGQVIGCILDAKRAQKDHAVRPLPIRLNEDGRTS